MSWTFYSQDPQYSHHLKKKKKKTIAYVQALLENRISQSQVPRIYMKIHFDALLQMLFSRIYRKPIHHLYMRDIRSSARHQIHETLKLNCVSML